MWIRGDFRRDFDAWASKHYSELHYESGIHLNISEGYGTISFYTAPELMQCVLIIEFLESLGCCVETLKDTNSKWKSYVNKVSQCDMFDNKEESMKETILSLQYKYNKGTYLNTLQA